MTGWVTVLHEKMQAVKERVCPRPSGLQVYSSLFCHPYSFHVNEGKRDSVHIVVKSSSMLCHINEYVPDAIVVESCRPN